ncbi:MAG: DNA mismatch repair endonuclease MutL [Candidatus Thorarchaeota archaeon]
MEKKSTTIVQLDQKTINKIAAGEVVERPASVVKELVENSIDAQASEISIYIESHGTELIKIVDNGIGMSASDASLAWKSHTTSKLKTIEDLDNIYTMGFRGEALASIASVSMMEIITKRKEDSIGISVRVKGGTLEKMEEINCATGTTISVRNLFYNVPARKKFLKTPTTELGHIIDIVNKQALINPSIHFKLIHNKTTLLNSPKSNNFLDSFFAVFGSDDAKQMLEINFESNQIKISGLISQPSLSRSTRDYEIFYVNNRYIKSQLLSDALEEAYKTLLMQHRYPVVVINIQIDPSLVDVNIHPAKREVRFGESNKIYDILINAIKRTLEEADLWRRDKGLLTSQFEGSKQSIMEFSDSGNIILNDNLITDITDKTSKEESSEVRLDSKLIFSENGSILPGRSSLDIQSNVVIFTDDFWIRPLGQAHNLYILCETSEGVAIIDIHATHERIKYEQLIDLFQTSKIQSQELLQPITFSLNKLQLAFLEENLDTLRKLGIDLEIFGGKTYIIRKLPVIMDLKITEDDILKLIDEMRKEVVNIKNINDRIDLIIKRMACHAVVRSGEAVSLEKITRILMDLRTCKQPFTCPHGRPTIIRITQKGLEKEFGRIV